MKPASTIFLSILGLLFLIGYDHMKNEEIKKSGWKYGSGYHISDFLRFDDNNLKGDTIYRSNKPIAVIIYCGKGMFRNSAILELESLATGESGIYHQKGPR